MNKFLFFVSIVFISFGYTFASTQTFQTYTNGAIQYIKTKPRIDYTPLVLPTVSPGYVSSGNILPNLGVMYYNGIVDIKADVSDPIGINGTTCMYTTDTHRYPASYTPLSSTSGYCYKNSIVGGSNLQIRFSVRNTSNALFTGAAENYILDTTAPTYSRNNPISGTRYTSGSIVPISVNITDTGVGVPQGAWCNVKIDGATSSFVQATVIYDIITNKCAGSLKLKNTLSDGPHYLTVQVSDLLSNTALSPTQTINFDATAPTYSRNNPISGTRYTSGSIVPISVNITDTGVGVPQGAWCNVKIDGATSSFVQSTVIYNIITNTCAGSLKLKNTLAPGPHYLTVQVSDLLSNTALSPTQTINFDAI